MFSLSVHPSAAQGLLRDADIENGLSQLANPLLVAAGLGSTGVKVLVVNDSSMNAFVISNDAIFLNYGLINRMGNAAMLQGVIAHEAAHISNGHIGRRLNNLDTARTAANFGIALAAVAAAVGGSQAGAGVLAGAQGSALQRFFRHTRAEEASADQSAVRYMRSAGVDPSGMSQVMNVFRGQELLAETRQDPYARTHPLSRDRIRALEGYVTAYGGEVPENASADYWFARVKGKLSAYTRSPKWTMQRLKDTPYADIQLLRTAIAEHRSARTQPALNAIDRAIEMRPNDAYLHDQRGQILLESRNFSAATKAYARAVELAPNEPLILSGYGRALLVTDNPAEAKRVLEKARTIDFRDGSMLRDLSVAYAKLGERGMASVVTAERYALAGRLEDAEIHAKRALGVLPEGSGPWQRAQDVLIAAERAEKRRRK